jgi:hypothetical protein
VSSPTDEGDGPAEARALLDALSPPVKPANPAATVCRVLSSTVTEDPGVLRLRPGEPTRQQTAALSRSLTLESMVELSGAKVSG